MGNNLSVSPRYTLPFEAIALMDLTSRAWLYMSKGLPLQTQSISLIK